MTRIVLWMYLTVGGVPQWVASPVDFYSMAACARAREQHRQNILYHDAPTACLIEGYHPGDAKESR